MEEEEELKRLEEDIMNWKEKRGNLKKEEYWKPEPIYYEKEEYTEEELRIALENYVEEHLEGYQKYEGKEMNIEWCSEHYFVCIRKKDNYMYRGFFQEWIEDEEMGEIFILKNPVRKDDSMRIEKEEYEIYFRFGKVDNRSKMRLQLEKFLRTKSIRVRKKKREEIEKIDEIDWKEIIDENESQDVYEKIEDENPH